MKVGFMVDGLTSETVAKKAPVKFDKHMRYNHGNGYDKATGKYTAPLSGVYMFIATSSAYKKDTVCKMYLMVANTWIASARMPGTGKSDEEGPASTAHGLMHMKAGDTAYLESGSGCKYDSTYSQFNGFMIAPDL